MKRKLFILFTVLLSFAAMATDWDGTTATDFGTQVPNAGDSEDNPIIITTPMQWMYAANLLEEDTNRAKCYALGDNLDFKGLPGVKSFGSLHSGAFFDGKGYAISNIYLSDLTKGCGLFTVVNKTTIKNLGLASGSIIGLENTGGIVGQATNSTIINCYNKATISGDVVTTPSENSRGSLIGGIVGSSTGASIYDCYNEGSVTGTFRVGGIVGIVEESTSIDIPVTEIARCYNTGNIQTVVLPGLTSYGSVAGIAGLINKNTSITISGCYNTGNITFEGGVGNGTYIAGIVAQSDSSTPTKPGISNCYNTGIVRMNIAGLPTPVIGGIVAQCVTDLTVSNCYNAGDVYWYGGTSTGNNIGGIMGNNSIALKGGVTNCYTLEANPINMKNYNLGGTKIFESDLLNPEMYIPLNNYQNPAVWKNDFANPVNGPGYPILAWQQQPESYVVTVVDSGENIDINVSKPGKVSLNTGVNSVYNGTVLTIMPHAKNGYVLDGLFVNGQKYSSSTFTVRADATIEAKYHKKSNITMCGRSCYTLGDTTRWQYVYNKINTYKFYYGLVNNNVLTTDLAKDSVRTFLKALIKKNIKISIETAGLLVNYCNVDDCGTLSFNNDLNGLRIFRSLIKEIDPNRDIDALEFDGAISRCLNLDNYSQNPTIYNFQTALQEYYKMTSLWRETIPGIELIDIANMVRWRWRNVPAYSRNPAYGNYSDFLDAIQSETLSTGVRVIDGTSIDFPYGYAIDAFPGGNLGYDRMAVLKEIQTKLQNMGLSCGVIFNTGVGTATGTINTNSDYTNLTLAYINLYQQQVGMPLDSYHIQTWYELPSKWLPETTDFTMTNLTLRAINLIATIPGTDQTPNAVATQSKRIANIFATGNVININKETDTNNTIHIYNMQGVLIKSVQTHQAHNQVPVNSSGIYLVLILDSGGKTAQKVLVNSF